MAVAAAMDGIDQSLPVLRAAADPTRLRILLALDRRALCVCELVALLDVGQPAVSRHLGILQRAGLVDSRRDGWWTEYRVVAKPDSEVARGVLRGLRAETREDPGLRGFLAAVATVDRHHLRGGATPPRCTKRQREGERA